MKFETILRLAFDEASRIFDVLPREAGKAIATAGESFGSLSNDTEILADKVIGAGLQKFLLELDVVPNWLSRLTVEGYGDISVSETGRFWVTIDPLDGSLNYVTGDEFCSFPVTCVITILDDNGESTTFGDIVAAGILNFISGNRAIAVRGGLKFLNKEGREFSRRVIDPRANLDITQQIVICEGYYPETRQLIQQIFNGQKGWLRNPGSAAYEMFAVAYGIAVAYICDQQKQHELGAGYLFMKACGGVALDFEGNDLESHLYKFNAQTACILAITSEIGDELLRRIQG